MRDESDATCRYEIEGERRRERKRASEGGEVKVFKLSKMYGTVLGMHHDFVGKYLLLWGDGGGRGKGKL